MSHFADLVGGAAADTLDDGEAATIACAMERSAIALIDDRKAIRLWAERFPHLAVGCTLDVLAQQHVPGSAQRSCVPVRTAHPLDAPLGVGRVWTGR